MQVEKEALYETAAAVIGARHLRDDELKERTAASFR